MSWECPDYIETNFKDGNLEIARLKGELDDEEAKINLIKYLRANLGIACELLLGIKLAPFQEIALRNMFNCNYTMLVLTRGGGKGFLAAIFCILYCIFKERTKIILAGPTFRTARMIFEEIEKFTERKDAILARQCYLRENKSRRADAFQWKINGGSITAIPLSGERIRGFRANVLICDEYLLLSQEMIDVVLKPFLVVPGDITERQKIIEEETRLIEQGAMTEDERTNFKDDFRMIAMSSASYTFDNLYKTFVEWIDHIKDEKNQESASKYFVLQMGCKALPKYMMNQDMIDAEEAGGTNSAAYQREYGAQFVDGSDSYYSVKKMKAVTMEGGQYPTVKIFGDPNKKYIIGVDPNYSSASNSDYFGMSVLELDDEDPESSTLVHSYAVAGGNLKDHINYFYFLLKFFKPELVMVDNAHFGFVDSCNLSPIFASNGIEIKFLDFNTVIEGEDYTKELRRIRREYSKSNYKFCIKQVFTSEFLRRANQELQSNIDRKKIWFGSKIEEVGNERIFRSVVKECNSLDPAMQKLLPKKFTKVGDYPLAFIDFQDEWIDQTKKQCSLIEVTSTIRGTQSFDLPLCLRRSKSPKRARKDNYTTLMLANWGVKVYNDIQNEEEDDGIIQTFRPQIVGLSQGHSYY